MIQVRRGVFETNSSSTHSIAIPKPANRDYPCFVRFTPGYFGWSFDDCVNSGNYLYTAVLSCPDKKEKMEYIKDVLDKHNIKYIFDPPMFEVYGDCEFPCYGIDHADCLEEFLEAVFKDERTLLDFIFYGIVITGNDNGSDEIDLEAYLYRMNKTCKDWWGEEIPNPYYKPGYENYDWYLKIN